MIGSQFAILKSLLSFQLVISGTSPNTGGTANTSTSIELDSNASSVTGAYDPSIIVITNGTGKGQSRQIFEYNGTTKKAYINREWKVIPDNTSEYAVLFYAGDTHINEGVAAGGGDNYITLNALASDQNGIYQGQIVFIVAGTGQDQARMCIAYNGSTKRATVDSDWNINPDETSVYEILPWPGFVHAVPEADSVKNILIRDAVGNKNDTHVSGSLHGKTELILEHLHSDIFTRPNLTAGVTLTTPGGSWAGGYGPKVEVIPANNITSDFDLHFMSISNISANGLYQVQLYSGGAGSEVAEGDGFAISRSAVQSQEGTRKILTRVFPANTRISAAVAGGVAGAETVVVKVEGHTY